MTLWNPKAGEVEIGQVVAGMIERREKYWALQKINAKFSFSDRRKIEKAMRDHKDRSAEFMMDCAAFVVTQIEKPWREQAQKGGSA